MRRVLPVLAILLAPSMVPMIGAAPVAGAPATPEQIVESHSVWAVMGTTAPTPSMGPALASPAPVPPPSPWVSSPRSYSSSGVRWFNDEYLLDPGQAPEDVAAVAVLVREEGGRPGGDRHPCSGAVLVVRAGAPDPRVVLADPEGHDFRYNRSFVVTDPNGFSWIVDEWSHRWGSHGWIWTVAVLGKSASMSITDDGVSTCEPVHDQVTAQDPGHNGGRYPSRPADAPPGDPFRYNALLVIPTHGWMMTDGSKWHGEESRTAPDTTACHASACPGGDDDAEGNSHAFRPTVWPGNAPHPGPDDGDPDPHASHDLWDVDVYYGTAPRPAVRSFDLIDGESGTGDYAGRGATPPIPPPPVTPPPPPPQEKSCPSRSGQLKTCSPGSLAPVQRIAAGSRHSCVVVDGNVDCWGDDAQGQSSDRFEGDAVAVSAGAAHTCIVTSGRDVECWGDSAFGRTQAHRGWNAVDVAAGGSHTCFLMQGGYVWCFGADSNGQLVQDWTGDVLQVAAGRSHTCLLRASGAVDCAGAGAAAADDLTGDAVAITAGGSHTCALTVESNVRCWGSPGRQTTQYDGGDAVQVSAGTAHTCVLKRDGNVFCAGANRQGEASGYAGGDAVAISAGAYHTLILKRDGTVVGIGRGNAALDFAQGESYP